MKVAIGATGVVVGCCALHLGVAAIVAGAVWSWPIAGFAAAIVVAVGIAERRRSGCCVVTDAASPLPVVAEHRR